MKIEVETKYNIGEELYYVTPTNTIRRRKINLISIREFKEKRHITYYFEDTGDFVQENFMEDYFKTPYDASQYIAKRALEELDIKK